MTASGSSLKVRSLGAPVATPFCSLVSLEGVVPHDVQVGCRCSSAGAGKSHHWRVRKSHEHQVLLAVFKLCFLISSGIEKTCSVGSDMKLGTDMVLVRWPT